MNNVAIVRRKHGFSLVWLVPITALLVGAWLLYDTFAKRGPEIQIEFADAEGIEAGRTKIKYKNVEIGHVESVTLSQDLASVFVHVRVMKSATDYLRSDTKFWIVKPRIGRAGVTGLGTIVSGAYITLDPGRAKKFQRAFVGLETPPTITGDTAGRHYKLTAVSRGSLNVGSPVYFRDVEVGQITAIQFTGDRETIEIDVFIEGPHYASVTPSAKFWNASGVEFSIDSDGVDVQIASLETLVAGGIAFETLDVGDSKTPVPAGSRFRLFSSRSQIYETVFTERISYVMFFDDSVRGLNVGAPVEFRGIKIGTVTEISIEYNATSKSVLIPIRIEVEPGRVGSLLQGSIDSSAAAALDALIARGLSAQLQTGTLLTGQLFVGLDFFDDPKFSGIEPLPYPEIPTVPSVFVQFEDAAINLLGKLEDLPINQLVTDLSQAAEQLREVLGNPAIQRSLALTEESLRKLTELSNRLETITIPQIEASAASYDTSSVFYREAREAVEEVTNAAESVSRLAEQIETTPEILIRGKR